MADVAVARTACARCPTTPGLADDERARNQDAVRARRGRRRRRHRRVRHGHRQEQRAVRDPPRHAEEHRGVVPGDRPRGTRRARRATACCSTRGPTSSGYDALPRSPRRRRDPRGDARARPSTCSGSSTAAAAGIARSSATSTRRSSRAARRATCVAASASPTWSRRRCPRRTSRARAVPGPASPRRSRAGPRHVRASSGCARCASGSPTPKACRPTSCSATPRFGTWPRSIRKPHRDGDGLGRRTGQARALRRGLPRSAARRLNATRTFRVNAASHRPGLGLPGADRPRLSRS